MSNMSYCRFRNTLSDLGECQRALEDLFDGAAAAALSPEETRAAQGLIKTCYDILQLVGDQNGFDVFSEDGERLDDSTLLNEILGYANGLAEDPS